MNIVLIGMRGSGKMTVGKLLAKTLQKNHIEMDGRVVKKAKMSIPEIVKKYGWEHFRNLESEVTKELAKMDNVIIATGGGVVTRPENIQVLKEHGKLFWLQASLDTLVKRIGDDKNRPSLTGKQSQRDDLEAVLAQRQKLYEDAADAIIDTEGKTIKEVVAMIITNLEDTYVY